MKGIEKLNHISSNLAIGFIADHFVIALEGEDNHKLAEQESEVLESASSILDQISNILDEPHLVSLRLPRGDCLILLQAGFGWLASKELSGDRPPDKSALKFHIVDLQKTMDKLIKGKLVNKTDLDKLKHFFEFIGQQTLKDNEEIHLWR